MKELIKKIPAIQISKQVLTKKSCLTPDPGLREGSRLLLNLDITTISQHGLAVTGKAHLFKAK